MKIGFIGMGNMAQALAQGFIASGRVAGEAVIAYAPHQEKLRANAEKIGFVPAASQKEVTENCSMIFLACKPYQIMDVLEEAGEALKNKALVSVCAGWDYERFGKVLPESVRFQFVMPNTPAMVGKGVLLLEERNSLLPEEREFLCSLLGTLGIVEECPSHLMEIAGTITGCGPAFADLITEAYGDAAVKYGAPRALAYRLVSSMLEGAAALQLATGEHPGSLKDKVCSPGGTTILGVQALEDAGLRSACMRSVDAIMRREK